MRRHSLKIAGWIIAVLCLGDARPVARGGNQFVFHQENVLGTSMEMRLEASSADAAENARTAAIAEINRLVGILSSWSPTSEFSRWFTTRGVPQEISPELFEVLDLYDHWRERTGGALDASAESVTRAWKRAASDNRIPTPDELRTAVSSVRQKHWTLDAAAGTATHVSATPLALNSFTKSYIIDRAAAVALRSGGIRRIVLNIGGDLVVRGRGSETVQVADPFTDAENVAPVANLEVRDLAVATSGSYRRGFDIGGRHYSHIVDPRTGLPADEVVSATVAAPRAADAGALATAFAVLAPGDSRRLAATVPGAEYLILTKAGARITSPGWASLTSRDSSGRGIVPAAFAVPRAASSAGPQPGNAGWGASFELMLTVELATIGDFGYRRPFVAVWAEDKDHFQVRTLALWFDKDRWLPDLRSWFRSDRMRALVEGSEISNTVSSATRPSGRYTLKWDGKDNAGKPVRPGSYTLLFEAAREHGGYELLRQDITLDETPKQAHVAGKYELAGATLDYRRIAAK